MSSEGFKITLRVKYNKIELWQQWFLWTVWGISELSEQPALYLGFISIHRLSLLTPPAQYTRLVPEREIQHIPHQFSGVATSSQHTVAITVSVDDLLVPSNLQIHTWEEIINTDSTASHRLWVFSIICRLKTLQLLSLFVVSEDQQFSVQLGSLPRS